MSEGIQCACEFDVDRVVDPLVECLYHQRMREELERLRDIIDRAGRLNEQTGAQGMVQAVLWEAG